MASSGDPETGGSLSTIESNLRRFYLSGNEERTLFHQWEEGIPRGNSTTPSISSSAYRWWILEHLRNALDRDRRRLLLSIGAGNAFVERVLCREGYLVLALDALEEAVDLARRAGVPAIRQNILTWRSPHDRWGVIYADGVLGHLHDEADQAGETLESLRRCLVPGGTLVISNDAPPGDEPVRLSSNVPGFYWLSTGWIADELRQAGFEQISTASIRYRRPLSGARTRAIVTAHRGSEDGEPCR